VLISYLALKIYVIEKSSGIFQTSSRRVKMGAPLEGDNSAPSPKIDNTAPFKTLPTDGSLCSSPQRVRDFQYTTEF
jgi:hypothetical protein